MRGEGGRREGTEGREERRTEDRLGRNQESRARAKGVVEVCCALASELEMLALVFSYRDVGCPGREVRYSVICNRGEKRVYRWTRISAACRTG